MGKAIARRKTAAKKKTTSKSKRDMKTKPSPKKAAKKATAKKAKPAKKAKSSKKSAAKKAAPSLGRPKVTGEEKLYMLFKDDYHARQVFEFLRVETVKELEQFAPQEIVHRLSLPIRQTVDRIRKLLAAKNRSLKDDREFARKHKPAG